MRQNYQLIHQAGRAAAPPDAPFFDCVIVKHYLEELEKLLLLAHRTLSHSSTAPLVKSCNCPSLLSSSSFSSSEPYLSLSLSMALMLLLA